MGEGISREGRVCEGFPVECPVMKNSRKGRKVRNAAFAAIKIFNHGWTRSVNPIQNTHKIAKSIVN
jgi:hypothetical protein